MAHRTCDYLIIGNSAAGVTAAEHIRAHDGAGSIILVSREPHAAYGRPLISYLIEGKTDRAHMNFKGPDFYERHGIEALLGPDFEALTLDAEAHEVTLAGGDAVGYGRCLLATGSVPFTPPIPGLAEGTNVFPFLTLDDAQAAWDATVEATARAHNEGRKSRVLVIGAGLIGLKAAEALSHHCDEVLVLELAPRILPAVLDGDAAAMVQGQLEPHGIRCMPGVSAERLVLQDGAVVGAKLTDGGFAECDVVIAAVGVRPNSSLAVEAGAEQGRGLICNERLETTLPDVYAAGDVVEVCDLLDGSRRPLALWPNAMRQGKMAGLQMTGAADAEPFEGNFAVNAVDFFDISLLTAGVINPDPEGPFVQKVVIEGNTYAKFVTEGERLVGYILLNRPANAGLYTSLIENGTDITQLDPAVFDGAPLNLDFPADDRWDRLHRGYPGYLDRLGRKEGQL